MGTAVSGVITAGLLEEVQMRSKIGGTTDCAAHSSYPVFENDAGKVDALRNFL